MAKTKKKYMTGQEILDTFGNDEVLKLEELYQQFQLAADAAKEEWLNDYGNEELEATFREKSDQASQIRREIRSKQGEFAQIIQKKGEGFEPGRKAA